MKKSDLPPLVLPPELVAETKAADALTAGSQTFRHQQKQWTGLAHAAQRSAAEHNQQHRRLNQFAQELGFDRQAAALNNSVAKYLGYGNTMAELRKLDVGRSIVEEFEQSNLARMRDALGTSVGSWAEQLRAPLESISNGMGGLLKQLSAQLTANTEALSSIAGLRDQAQLIGALGGNEQFRDLVRSFTADAGVASYIATQFQPALEALRTAWPADDDDDEAIADEDAFFDRLPFAEISKIAETLATEETRDSTTTDSSISPQASSAIFDAAWWKWFLFVCAMVRFAWVDLPSGAVNWLELGEKLTDQKPAIDQAVSTVDRRQVVAPHRLPLLSEPDPNAEVRTMLRSGTIVACGTSINAWIEIEVEHEGSVLRGWVDANYLQRAKPLVPGKVLRSEAPILQASVPVTIVEAGPLAERRYIEFFTAHIRNRNTRTAYAHAANAFFDEVTRSGLALADVEPYHVATYIEHIGNRLSAPTVKQHLAALRQLFDWLVVGQVLPTNPAASVRGPKHSSHEGKTPILTDDEMRLLFAQFDDTKLSDVRDRAMLSVMVYSFARVSALANLRVKDYYRQGSSAWFLLSEKGGKQNKVPAHHQAAEAVERYIALAGIANERDAPLFRSIIGRGTKLSERALSRENVFAMVRRRTASVGLPREIGCHSFRGTGITNYLSHGGTLETAARIAGHVSTKTTQLYDRRDQAVKQAEIERIRF